MVRLQQNIDNITILIHGMPKTLLPDSNEELVQKPDITEASLFPPKLSGIVGSELRAPLSNVFVRNNDSAFGQEILDISEAHAEPMIDGIA
jgi:hypothetical protein